MFVYFNKIVNTHFSECDRVPFLMSLELGTHGILQLYFLYPSSMYIGQGCIHQNGEQLYVPNDHKITNIFHSRDFSKYYLTGIFGMKIHDLATLILLRGQQWLEKESASSFA
jgi:hypothetical protein